MAILTLLPEYINALGATGVSIGLFVTALEIARMVGVIPLGWSSDRFNKRLVFLFVLILSTFVYVLFIIVDSINGFLIARILQGFALSGTGLVGLALIGDLAPSDQRANYIGEYNSFRMAAGIAGNIGVGTLFAISGFPIVLGLIATLCFVGTVSVWLFVGEDTTRIKGFAFRDLVFNQRILTLISFRAQFSIAVTLVRNWFQSLLVSLRLRVDLLMDQQSSVSF